MEINMKKTVIMLLTAALVIASFSGCKNGNQGDESTPAPQETPFITFPEVTMPEVTDPSTPASMFEYTDTVGGVQIGKYVGEDVSVIVPSEIDGKAVVRIAPCAFQDNAAVEYVKLPSSVKAISYNSFFNCEKLVTVDLSEGLEEIGLFAFKNCTSLANIVLPQSLKYIGSQAFSGCSSLKHINLPPKAFGSDADASGIFSGSGLETVDIEEGVYVIPPLAFAKTDLKSVILPKSVWKIGTSAFSDCTKLSAIILNEGLMTVENSAFALTAIGSIFIPSSVKFINESAFNACTQLKEVKFDGNAPEKYAYTGEDSEDLIRIKYKVYYHYGAEGFTMPKWHGYVTETW